MEHYLVGGDAASAVCPGALTAKPLNPIYDIFNATYPRMGYVDQSAYDPSDYANVKLPSNASIARFRISIRD